jgi:hypothetical protein
VGFTSENEEFLAGISLLAALALAGGAALGIGALRRVGSSAPVRSAEMDRAEGQAAGAA